MNSYGKSFLAAECRRAKSREMKEDFEDMAAEARDRVDSAKAGDENAGGK